MNTLGNIIWIIFGGFIIAVAYFLSGLILLITVIGIPFGLQLIKIAGFALLPFGRKAVPSGAQPDFLSVIFNIIWLFIAGLSLALTHVVLALIFALTIIGIPFALQHLKLAGLALTPFGYKIVEDKQYLQ
ncbi:MAG: YccF domain-containing protein [Chlorobi bacterium]|nr:YccF domain-containing protein [Chlorobiota bacterium]